MRKPILLAALSLAATVVFAQQTTLPLWPHGTPEPPQVTAPEQDITKPTDRLVDGRPLKHLTNVTKPTLTLYKPSGKNTGAAVVVFPGGSYRILAWDLEGTEVCTWLNSIGVNCVLVKYRVPYPNHFPENTADLEDAQQAVRLTRAHAAQWGIDPHRVGVLGFSAGAHLVIVLGNHPGFQRPGEPANPISARPDFVFVIYPGYVSGGPGVVSSVAKGIDPSPDTPPTFLVQAENDPVHVENSLAYFEALKKVKVPAEMHLFAEGGHGFGLRPTSLPITHWPVYAEIWLHTIHVLPGPAGPAVR